MSSPQRKQLQQHRTPSDFTFLEDLLLSSPRTGSGATGSPMHQEKQLTAISLVAAQQRKKVPARLRHATAATVRQALFPSGAGSYPAENSPLRGGAQGVGGTRRVSCTEDPRGNDDELYEQQEAKRREMCWSTSFPAEYLKPTGTQRDATKLTLAFHEQQLQREWQQRLEQQQEQHQRLARAMDTRVANANEPLLRLHKQTMIREGLLAKLHEVVTLATQQREFDVSKGSELLHLLLELRSASVEVMRHLAEWHHYCIEQVSSPKLPRGTRDIETPLLPSFVFEKTNYCVKMVSDLNFLGSVSALGGVLGVDPTKMRQNPFMMPEPIPQREFADVQALEWRELGIAAKCIHRRQLYHKKDRQQQVEERDNQIAERVTEAETYLVWCLFNLQPPPSDRDESSASNRLPDRQPPQPTLGSWQSRAEKQLELLSRPLESSSGRAYVMDSSPMMKRKGVLPSLPLSPPKTLTELVDSVQHIPDPEPSLARVSEILAVEWSGTIFRCSTRELEALGSLSSPPHQIITIVAASVLILLSPSDRLPKDLSWASCCKMLLGGARLVDRLATFDVSSAPEFKWKALVPFLQNEQFQPRALLQLSSAAACLCAWVLSGLLQSRELAAASDSNEVDRLELLGELEVGEVERSIATAGSSSETRPKSKSGKRVSIGNTEILFINENQPVALTPTPHSRPSTSSSSLAPSTQPAASVLVRTSPWTFKGVTYFVSFFLEHEPSTDRSALSIKLYEPMSSVESQVYVTEEDLLEDFGDAAHSAFRRREYRSVCELILGQLDRMMGSLSSRSSDRDSSRNDAMPSSLDLLSRGEAGGQLDEGDQADEGDQEDADADAGYGDERELEQSFSREEDKSDSGGAMDANAAATRIQSLARQQSAKKTYLQLVKEREGEGLPIDEPPTEQQQQEQQVEEALEADKAEAILRIQCAARQKQARERVHHARHSRQKRMDEEERQRRILTRIPTGMPEEQEASQMPAPPSHGSLGAFTEAEDEGEESEGGGEKAADVSEADDAPVAVGVSKDTAVEEGEEEDGDAVAVQRPETSMSYASEQFEDDFDEE